MRGERGFALVITLIVTALLVALVVDFMDDVFVETSSRQNFVDAEQASLMANSGVEGAIKLIQVSGLAHPGYTTLADQWAKPLKVEDEKGSLTVTIEDETGKLNINLVTSSNTFYQETAGRLLKGQGLPLDLLDAVIDWIDSNDEPRPGGAESSYYLRLKQPYLAKNRPLDTQDEIALVRGFTTETRLRLNRVVTVYPVPAANAIAASAININTAPLGVIAALSDDMTPELAKRVVDYRATTPFTVQADLLKVPGMDRIGTGLMTNLTTKSSIFRVLSEARVGETTRTVEAVVDGSKLLYWREF